MHYTTAAAVFVAAAGLASAQSIDPNSVPIQTRDKWCQDQQTQCPLICLQTSANSASTEANSCDPTTLDYSCVCSNGQSPNASEYSQTIPYYVCTESNNQCVANCGTGNNACASNCRTQHPCGAQNPTLANSSTISSTMSATATSSSAAAGTNPADYTGFGGAPAATTAGGNKGNGNAAATAMNLGQSYGLAVVLAGLFVGFALVL